MIRFKTLSLLIVIATLSFACEREVITSTTTPTAALYGASGIVAPAPQCGSSNTTFITNAANSNLGNIEIANDQNSIYVMISMHPTRFMEELRVFVGDASTLDNDGTGNLIMEGFQFQSTFSAPQSRYTVILPKAGLGACVDVVLYGRVATRNAFGQMTNRTYVWADGLPLFNVETYKYCVGNCAVSGGGSGHTH